MAIGRPLLLTTLKGHDARVSDRSRRAPPTPSVTSRATSSCSTRLKGKSSRHPVARVDTTLMRRPMAGNPTLPVCECDCGVPGAERQVLMEAPRDDPWPRCVCPHCGPEPERPDDRRQCTTKVHPIMAAFTPGNLLLCADCRIACVEMAKRARAETKSQNEDKRTAVTETQEKRAATDDGLKDSE